MNSAILKKFIVLMCSLGVFPLVYAQNTVFQALEPLRFLSTVAASTDMSTRFIVFLLSLAIFIIALLAYRKTRTRRMAFVALAFLLFAGKWGLKVLDLFLSPGNFFPDTSENVVELLILASLFIAIFRK